MDKEPTSCEASSPITKEFLEKILSKNVSSYKASKGTNPGDNYTGELIALDIILVEDIENPLHLLYKTFPSHQFRQNLLKGFNVFEREFQIYNSWLPELKKMQTEIIKNDTILIPAMPEMVAGAAIDYTDENQVKGETLDPRLTNYILMVDVRKTYGFKMASKLESLKYHQVKSVMEELAKYHALGYAYKIHNKVTSVHSRFPIIECPFFCKPSQRQTIVSMMKANMKILMEACKDFLEERPGIKEALEKIKDPESIADKFRIFVDPEGMDENIVESYMRINPYPEGPLKDQWIVVNHGDCWTNNMLFKDDETKNVTSVILVDLQVARESCIMVDLVNFLYVCTDTEFRREYLNEMIELYYKKFTEFCEVLKVDQFLGFNLENFQRKFHRSKMLGLLFASLTLPNSLQRAESTRDLDKVDYRKSDDWSSMFQDMGRDEDDNKLLRERYTQLLEEMHDDGVL